MSRLPTPAKILLILSFSLLPIGLASAWSAKRGLDEANDAIEGRAHDQALVSSKAIQNLLTRNRLSLKVAANAALADGPSDACAEVQRILGLSPDLSRQFLLSDDNGQPICQVGNLGPLPTLTRLAPGDYRTWISPDHSALFLRAGVMGGSSTVRVPASEIRDMLTEQEWMVAWLILSADGQHLPGIAPLSRRGWLSDGGPLD